MFVILSAFGQDNEVVFLENFETQAGSNWTGQWVQEHIRGATDWTSARVNHTLLPRIPNFPHTGEENAIFFTMAGHISKLITPQINISALSNPVLEFWHTQATGYGGEQDTLRVYYKNSAAGTWTLLKEYTDNTRNWTRDRISLPARSGDYYIAFEARGYSGNGVQLDDVSVFNFTGSVGAEITSFLAPIEGYNPQLGASEQVRVRIKNTGSAPISGFQLRLEHFTVTDNQRTLVAEQTETFSGAAIASLSEGEHNFARRLNLSAKGEHIVRVTVNLGDVSTSSELKVFHVDCQPTAEIDENFRSEFFPPACWSTLWLGNGATRWEKAIGVAQRTPAVHRHSSLSEQEGWLVTPQISLPAANAGNMVVEFMSRNNNAALHRYNGVWVSTTNNNPASFQEIHELTGDEISGTWKKIILPLNNYAGRNIYIGFKYAGIDADDWFIDDVRVWNFTGWVDAELSSIVSPVSGYNLSNSEEVTVTIVNKGQAQLSGFRLSLYLNDVRIVEETYSGAPIPSFGSTDYTFNQRLNLSALGDYTVSVTVTAAGDDNPDNNTIVHHVANLNPPNFTSVVIDPVSIAYTGGPLRPRSIEVRAADRVLVWRTDFDWVITSSDLAAGQSSGTNVGTVTIRVFGIGEFEYVDDVLRTYTITKAIPHHTLPSNELNARYGDALSGVSLPNNWRWQSPTTIVGEVGTSSQHTAIFTSPNSPQNYEEVQFSINVHVLKAFGEIPVPTPESVTLNSITLNPVETSTGQDVEFAISASNTPPQTGWQTTLTFTGLTANTDYYIFARTQENDNYLQGDVSEPLAVRTASAPEITTTSPLPQATTNIHYTFVVIATGFDITWSIEDGALPIGFTINQDGEISGVTTISGTYNFSVVATNLAGMSSVEFTLVVAGSPGANVDMPTLADNGITRNSITINTVAPPDNGQIVEYAFSRDDIAPETGWVTSSDNQLLFLGLIGNTTYYIFARSQANSVYASGAPSQPLVASTDATFDIIVETLPNGKVDAVYDGATLVSDGLPPIEWSVIDGDFAATGLALSSDGIISGTPSGAGTFHFEVRAHRSAANLAASAWLTIVIEKSDGAVVESPVIDAQTSSTITVLPVTPPSERQEVEYAVNIINEPPASGWQTELTFTGLTASTTYYVFARSKENDNYHAGAASQATMATTEDIQTWTEENFHNDNALKAWINNGRLHVSGLTAGKQWSIYSVTGALVYRNIAHSNEVDIILPENGVFIIRSENKTVRVVKNEE